MNVVTVTQGNSPLVLGQPHGGTHVPVAIFDRLNARGRGLDDTDWHIARLYDGLIDDVTVVQSHIHRYVIDANRDPGGASLYPGQNTTSLCPLTDFDGEAIWQPGQEPGPDEIDERRALYHAPYHVALADELARIRNRHGYVILYDCHSIRSEIPFLFSGLLPVFNIGTDGGTTCAPALERDVERLCHAAAGFDTVLNGRFRGGWTTRHYAASDRGVHCIQMELAQRAYMDEAAPWTYRPDRAEHLRPVLRDILHRLRQLPPDETAR